MRSVVEIDTSPRHVTARYLVEVDQTMPSAARGNASVVEGTLRVGWRLAWSEEHSKGAIVIDHKQIRDSDAVVELDERNARVDAIRCLRECRDSHLL